MPKFREWYTFAEWGKRWGESSKYHPVGCVDKLTFTLGDIVSVSILGQRLVVINSVKALEEFGKKGSIYSDRPVVPMGGVLLGYDQGLVLVRYGAQWRTFRKHFSQAFSHGKPIQCLQEVVAEESKAFVRRVLETPEDLTNHCNK